jgi:hypothetical protein
MVGSCVYVKFMLGLEKRDLGVEMMLRNLGKRVSGVSIANSTEFPSSSSISTDIAKDHRAFSLIGGITVQ